MSSSPTTCAGSGTFVAGAAAPDTPSARERWFLVHQAGLVVRVEGSGSDGGGVAEGSVAGSGVTGSVALPARSDVLELGFDLELARYVGRLDGDDCFALHVGEAAVAEPWSVQGLRSLFVPLGEEPFVVAGRAVQLAAFGDTHRFCGRCGKPTRPLAHEHAARCEACGLVCYPRIAPAIIVLVRRGERALLARSARFTTGMYSTLAGFVEPGESLEQTLAREVREEVGIEVDEMRYFGSQPWPFPHSLMVGFVARHAGGEIRVDGEEIVDARWFTVDDLPAIPPRPSIARKLIDAWIDDVRSGR